MTLLGIDPGEHNGIARWLPGEKDLKVYTKEFWDTYEFVTGDFDPDSTVIFMENPGKNKPVFDRGIKSRKKMLKIAQNVGMNKQDAHRLIQGFQRAGYVVMEIRPASRKWAANEFRAYTGLEISTNQHVRDAAKLVYGRPAVAALQFEQLKKQAADA